MPVGPSQTVEKAFLEAITKKTNYTAQTVLYISLHSADPGDTGANELTGGAYARVQLDPDTNNATNTNWNAVDQTGDPSFVTNKLPITFPTPSADWNGGAAIKWFGLWDASTSGVYKWGGTINGAVGVVVLNGVILTFAGGATGQLQLTLQ